MTKYRKEYRKIAKRLTLADIQGGVNDDQLSLDNLVSDGRVNSSSNFLMGVFSEKGILRVLEAFGFLKLLAKIGLKNICMQLDSSDPHCHRLYLFHDKPLTEKKICELVLKQGPIHFQEGILSNFPERDPVLLQIEWLLLQNPAIEFSARRPRLPGQSYPGLGLGDRLMELLIIMTRRLALEGMVAKPNYYHTAYIFARDFVFVNPVHQAILRRINQDLLSKYSFYTAAWASYYDCIINTVDNQIFTWEPGYLILPLTKDYIRYFRSKEYLKEVEVHIPEFRFRIDKAKFTEHMRANALEIYDTIQS